jgi:hypothetical protein
VLAALVVAGLGAVGVSGNGAGAAHPPGWWSAGQRRAVLEKTLRLRLAPDLSALSPGERAAVDELIAAGRILENLYELSLHRQAPEASKAVAALARDRRRAGEAADFADLYRVFQGPIATTLDNARVPFMPADPLVPGKNVYPWGVTKDEIERYLSGHPGQRESLLEPRTVVRRATLRQIQADVTALGWHPALKALHPRLDERLRTLERFGSRDGFYAVPYALAYADSLARVSALLFRAADHVEGADPDFADYLRARARDLISNDYQAGDAAWVTGPFGRLNAQIGAYETYDDELFGVKAFHGLSLMLADEKESRALEQALGSLQTMEESLPYRPHKTIPRVSVGVYDVIADFGQTRGTNTATILPNENRTARRYGRTIMIRRNIIMHPDLVASARDSWRAALSARHRDDQQVDGSFYYTLWHEIGHYLGPDRDRTGRGLDLALEEESGTFEEMKADLVSLFVAEALEREGYYDERKLRGVYAAGIARVLLKSQPRPDQVYAVMQLMQLNWFLEHGLLDFDRAAHQLSIHYERYHAVVAELLEQVLAIQQAGDKAGAERFIERWSAWDERHQALAKALRDAEKSRFRLVRYAALGE